MTITNKFRIFDNPQGLTVEVAASRVRSLDPDSEVGLSGQYIQVHSITLDDSQIETML
jgi:hypothetical protein